MIQYAIASFARILEEEISTEQEPFGCSIIYSELSDASRETDGNNIYLKPVNIARDTENRRHRMTLSFTGEDNTHELVDVLPCIVELQIAINLYRGIDEFYRLLPLLYKGFVNGFNFSMLVQLGKNTESIPVNVSPLDDSGNLVFPDFPNEPDSDRPQIIFDMKMTNVFLIMDSRCVQRIEFLTRKDYPSAGISDIIKER